MKPWGMMRRFGASAAPAGRRWWRIAVTASNGYVGAQFVEIEFRAIPGGADLTTPSDATTRAFANSTYTTYYPRQAFDDLPGTVWFTDIKPTAPSPRIIGYVFDAPTAINEISVLPVPSGSVLTIAPLDFRVESSANSTNGIDGTWDVEWSVSGQVGWSYDETRIFTRPGL